MDRTTLQAEFLHIQESKCPKSEDWSGASINRVGFPPLLFCFLEGWLLRLEAFFVSCFLTILLVDLGSSWSLMDYFSCPYQSKYKEVPSLDQISETFEEVLDFLKHHLSEHFSLEYSTHQKTSFECQNLIIATKIKASRCQEQTEFDRE